MNIEKWLKRNYPESYKALTKELSEYFKIELKFKKMKIARLTNYYTNNYINETYKKGTIFLFKKTKEDWEYGWTGNFEAHSLFKCNDPKITPSGYHYSQFNYHSNCYEIIKK